MEVKSSFQLIEPFRPDAADKAQAQQSYGNLWEMALTEVKRNFPVATSYCLAVNYDTKTDRYVGSFLIGKEANKVKLANPVAKFLLANLRIRDQRGSETVAQVFLHLDDNAVCDDVLMVTL